MEKVAIVTDSSSNLTYEDYKKLNTQVITLDINFTNKTYGFFEDNQIDDFYRDLDKEIPKTSAPSPGEVIERLEGIYNQGYDKVIMLPISKGLSSFYSMLELISEDEQYCDRFFVIDTRTTSLPLGLLVIYACKLRDKGLECKDIIDEVNRVADDTTFYAVLDGLDHLIKGGRIGKVTGSFGQLLNIKPLLMIDKEDGQVKAAGKVRGAQKGLEKMTDLLKNDLKGHSKYYLALGYGKDTSHLEDLKEMLKDEIQNAQVVLIDRITPVVQVHSGPGIIGCAYLIVD